MEKVNAEQKPDIQDGELTEQELNKVSGGDGPPGTAGDGNGRVYSQAQKYLHKASPKTY
jgi:bacteriocin-like protein